jgi:tryptophan-associated transmembrane protein
MTPSRQLRLAAAGAGAASVVALFALSRTWQVVVTVQAAPLPAQVREVTGSALRPELTAFALVGLAGAAALLATRATARRLIGAPLGLAGLVLAAGSATLLNQAGIRLAWVLLTLVGGLALSAAGGLVLASAGGWPDPAARYERHLERHPERLPEPGAASEVGLWDAIDRGEDPTQSGGSH